MKRFSILLSLVVGFSHAQQCEDSFRQLEHTLDTTCIPENPGRIVAIGTDATEALLSLNIIPIAFAAWVGSGNEAATPKYMSERFDLSESRFLGGENTPSLEGVVVANPDLIIMSQSLSDLYPSLSEIAPTVAFTWFDADEERVAWKDFLRDVASAVGRAEEAEALLNTYTERTDTLRSLLEQPPTTVSLLRFRPEELRIYLKDSYSGSILQDAGVQRPEAQQEAGFALGGISLEKIQLADGDVILIAQGDPESILFDQFTDSPLWQTLEGIKNNQVFQVEHNTWIGAAGIIAAHDILDDLFRFVVKVDPQEVSPNPFNQ